MNHKAIVIKQLNEQAAELENQLAATRTAIIALGGFTSTSTKATGKAVAGRKGGGWPKGKKRGPKGPQAVPSANAGAVGANAPTEAIPADLQAQIDAIKANPKLKGIAVAQAVRKAKIAYYKAQAPVPAPASTPTTGASLESAAN